MPNTPAQIGQGMVVWLASQAMPDSVIPEVERVLGALGTQIRVRDEAALDMATAVSGSGPAYVFLFMEAFIDAAVHVGFSRDVAQTLVKKTITGSMAYLEETGLHPEILKNNVTSPAGTTAAALYCLEKDGLRTAVSDAVWAAFNRSREVGQGKPNAKPV
jgi:pyrroline-5-carboxylate reductase